ncbi:hypothetical protein EHQ58_04680 [Leptospira ognonensis]|uniref:Uncharacterized protein n=1 Tax=Leptospira ognonensis TaxID=2484945 RepID=A0A4R9K8T6_9LEPT|nr:hypothetical protein [Leptospira ognonensis]TGL61906.1 hypothetical protein EHQ58_04680 [Leptospira ognonensis]
MSHDHGWKQVGQVKLQDGFSFHPKLSEWLLELTTLKPEMDVTVFEASCGEVNCPVEEVKLTWIIAGAEDKLRLGRGKEKLLKQDVYLAWKKKMMS